MFYGKIDIVKSITEVKGLINKYKNKFIISAILLSICFLIVAPNVKNAQAIDTKAKTAIIVDIDTGYILYSKDADEALPPASMTKMMTEYLVLEQISKGNISWDTKTEISDYAYWISNENIFSGVGLIKNKEYSVKSLYEAMAINSDNATSVTLAELIAGTEDDFVQLMNEKAEELDMQDTQFVNATGIDNILLDGKHPKSTKKDDTNLMSARDSAKLGYHIVKDYPEALEISSMVKTNFDGTEILNSNWMLKHEASFLKPYYYKGVNGLKTGHTDLAGYTLTATAEKEGKHLITVVMKTNSRDERFKETEKLLNYGFDKFVDVELFPANFQIEKESIISVDKGKEETVEIAIKEAISLPIEKGTKEKYKLVYQMDKNLLNEDDKLEAPIKSGEKVGTAEVIPDESVTYGSILNDNEKIVVDLVAVNDVEKKNWFSLLVNGIEQFFINLLNK